MYSRTNKFSGRNIFLTSNIKSSESDIPDLKDSFIINDPEKKEFDDLQEDIYLLGIGDALSLKIMGAPELSTEIRILNDGNVSLPLVGTQKLSGFTIKKGEEHIENLLSDELLNPQVELKLIRSRPITISIIGQVSRPGVYKLDSNSNDLPSLINSIEEAGGLSKNADLSNIYLKRRIPGSTVKYKKTKLNLKELILNGNLMQNPYLFDGDIIRINEAKNSNKELLLITSSTLSPENIRVNFIGEVLSPGTREIKPNSTLVEGILAAGGPTDWRSNYKFVEILRMNRNGTGFRKRYKINLAGNYSEKDNPILNDGDSVWVRKNNFAKTTDALGVVAKPLGDLVSIWTLFKLVD